MLRVPAQQKAKGEMEKGNENDENNKCATVTMTGGSSWENGDVHSSVEGDTSASSSPHLLFDFYLGQEKMFVARDPDEPRRLVDMKACWFANSYKALLMNGKVTVMAARTRVAAEGDRDNMHTREEESQQLWEQNLLRKEEALGSDHPSLAMHIQN